MSGTAELVLKCGFPGCKRIRVLPFQEECCSHPVFIPKYEKYDWQGWTFEFPDDFGGELKVLCNEHREVK